MDLSRYGPKLQTYLSVLVIMVFVLALVVLMMLIVDVMVPYLF